MDKEISSIAINVRNFWYKVCSTLEIYFTKTGCVIMELVSLYSCIFPKKFNIEDCPLSYVPGSVL